MAVTLGKGGLQSTPGKNPFKKKEEEVNKPFKPQQATETTEFKDGKVVSKTFEGKNYPTTNPNFVPNPNATIVDAKGGETRTLSTGEKITLTPEEARALTPNNPAGATPTENTQRIINDRLGLRPEVPFIEPQPLDPNIQPAGLDALDIGKVGAGAIAGATTLGGIGTAILPGVGTVIGGVAGAVIGGASALFYSSASERKQQTKVSYAKFTDATGQMENIINDVNAGNISKEQARAYWYNEYERVIQSEQEIKAQQDALFGDKLSKSSDEYAKVKAWLRRYNRFNQDFELAMAQPDPLKITRSIGVAPATSDTQEQ